MTRPLSTSALLSFIITISLFFLATQSIATCTKEKIDAAGEAMTSVTDWINLYDFYTKFSDCDDGYIASGIDVTMEGMFISQWDKLNTLNSIMASHPDFSAFIIRHVNEAYSMEGGETILKNAVNKCPAGSESLCQIIRERLKN